MAALRVSTPDKGIRIVDLGHGAGHHHDYEREREQAIRFLEWGRWPWRVTLRKVLISDGR
jgi:nitric oxide synthase oxygenase domain/subunit